jgi:REP element-mobilizing transposase RayT
MDPVAKTRDSAVARMLFIQQMSHRRRLAGVDYSAPGTYLLTAVTDRRRKMLGSLGPKGVTLSPIGEWVAEAWSRIPTYRPWVSLGAFIVMPDHWHGIVSWHRVPPGRAGHLSIIVAGMKAEATRLARESGAIGPADALWMRSYDVRFLNSSAAIEAAEQYVIENPDRAYRSGGVSRRSPP